MIIFITITIIIIITISITIIIIVIIIITGRTGWSSSPTSGRWGTRSRQ